MVQNRNHMSCWDANSIGILWDTICVSSREAAFLLSLPVLRCLVKGNPLSRRHSAYCHTQAAWRSTPDINTSFYNHREIKYKLCPYRHNTPYIFILHIFYTTCYRISYDSLSLISLQGNTLPVLPCASLGTRRIFRI